MVHKLFNDNSILNQFIAEIRNIEVQSDRYRFRSNMERIGQIFAYEISKHLEYADADIETPLGVSECEVPDDRIVLATILRAGLPLHNGLLSYFDKADNAFISAYRQHHKDGTFEIKMQYITCPNLDKSVLIISDPMLATGASMEKTIMALQDHGIPREIHVATVIASASGINHINRLFPEVQIWVAAIDEELTAKSYIVPGLGDAGDLAFGEKVQD